jgi:non-ribosomal peptide synthetase component F
MAGYEPLELPGDRGHATRGAVGLALDTHATGSMPFALDADAWQAVQQLCAGLGCTPYTVVATAYLLFLTRWSRRRDACLLTGNFHRNRRGSEAIVGDFNTAYPLRVVFDEDATLEAAVMRCHEAVLAHRANAHVAPTSALGTWSEWSRYTYNYLVDEAAAAHAAATDLGTAKLEPLDWNIPSGRPDDLALLVWKGETGIRGSLEYNSERFSPELAAKMVSRIRQLVVALTTEATAMVRSLSREP